MFNRDNDGYPYVIFSWLLFAIATPLVVIRLYVQFRFRTRVWREIFVVVAWLLYLGYTLCTSLDNGWDTYNASVSWEVEPEVYTMAMKSNLTTVFCFLPSLYACKFALLCLYGDLITRSSFPKVWWTIRASWVLCIAGLLARIIDIVVQCRPMSLLWEWPIATGRCEPSWGPSKVTLWVLHIRTDVLVYAVPIYIIYAHTGLSRKQKKGALWLFALGFLNVLSAIAMMAYWMQSNHQRSQGLDFTVAMNLGLPFQAGSAVIIICLPYCRRFWRGANDQIIRAEVDAEHLRLSAPSKRMATHGATQTRDIEGGDVEKGDAAS